MKVVKRNGEIVVWNSFKIINAMRKAFVEVGISGNGDKWTKLNKVDQDLFLNYLYGLVFDNLQLNKSKEKNEIYSVENIQDAVEKVLMQTEPNVAKAYIIYRQKRTEARELIALVPDPNAIADYIHPSKYAKYDPLLHRRETYEETIDRVEQMHLDKFSPLTSFIKRAFNFVKQKKVLPSMRSMQFAGRGIKDHNARIFNCSYTHIDRPKVFSELLYLLLCGCGCGFSVQKHHIEKLDEIKTINKNIVKHHAINDSIEGWADAVDELINSYYNGYYIEFSYHGIRSVGSPLESSGGRAPGHLPIKKLLHKIQKILDNTQGRKLKPIETFDICCHIAESVLAGGIRRSSLCALFSPDDQEMLYAKDKDNFDFNGKNSHRAMSNNSAILLRDKITKDFFMKIMNLNRSNYGDPGFVFVDNLNHGFNPCYEIGMNPTIDINHTGFSFCNLTEINAAACKDPEEFKLACEFAAFIGTLQASYTNFKYLSKESREIAERDALIGVSITGIMDNPSMTENAPFLEEIVERINKVNKETAKLIGINPAKRTTCIKPSGTASLELGCVGSGIHCHHAERYFRRITANPLEIPAQHFKDINPHMVEEKPNGDWCLTFPVKAPDNAIIQEAMGSLDFLNHIFRIYNHWIMPGRIDQYGPSHNVSATVVVEENNWDLVLDIIWNKRDKVTAMSFLPISSDKGIPYMPREKVVTEEDWTKWKYLIENYKPVDYTTMIEDEDNTHLIGEIACSGEVCEFTHRTKFHENGIVIWDDKNKFGYTKSIDCYFNKTIDNFVIGDYITRRIMCGRAVIYESGIILGFEKDKTTKAPIMLVKAVKCQN